MQFKSDKLVKPVCGLSRCYAHTPPENRSVHSVSMELGVGEMTIHRWITQIKDGTINFEQDEENPSGQRSMTEKLNLLLEYQKIPQDQNGEWLIQNGLHEEHLNLFLQEIKKLMANKVDDKDQEIKKLKKQLAKKTAASQTAKESSSTNVAKNKTMTINENLKLRSGEATSTQVLTVMSAGTKVKILELGKSEAVDGEEITFAGGVSWSFCKCGSDIWSWQEITEK